MARKATKKGEKPKAIRGPDDGKRGPVRVKLGNSQKNDILDWLRRGLKRVSACKKVEVHYRDFLADKDEDPEFHKAVIEAERYRTEQLHTVIYSAALDGDMQNARFLYQIELQSSAAAQARREARQARERAAGALADVGSPDDADPTLAADWRAFRALRALQRAERATIGGSETGG